MKKLLIFFDNLTFKINGIIINYIKRWVVYKIINEYKKYDNIFMFKIHPEFTEKNISVNEIEESMCDILMWLNNVIYKTYENYPTMSFKLIFDKINMSCDVDKNKHVGVLDEDEILIFTSIIWNKHNFTKMNTDYINKIIQNKTSKIKIINMGEIEFIKTLFPEIDEMTIDINCFKIENINLNKIINFNEMNIVEISDKYKNYPNSNDKLSFSPHEYIKLMYEIESLVISDISLDTETIKNINIILNNVEVSNIFKQNITMQNILKSYKNAISDILIRKNNLIIDIPINKLSKELSTSYVKYIFEFYTIIYPKIFHYNSLHKTNKIYKNIPKCTSEIKIQNIKKIDLDENDISCEYLLSSLTMTNWKEEYDNVNPFGFLIKYNPCKLSSKGILDVNSSILKTYPNMIINNITTNYISMYDYYQIILFDYEKNDDEIDEKKIFNISQFNIIDNINGNGNVMLPLYINKNHWELVRNLWSYHISFINNCFEYEYNNKMDNIYFYSILKLLNTLKNTCDDSKNNKSILKLFCYLLRTCIQILIDNKFMHNVKNDYKKYFNLCMNLNSFDDNSTFSECIIRLIQLIISNGISDDELELDLNKITSFIFNKYIIANYKMDFWDMINNQSMSNEVVESKLNELKEQVVMENIYWIHLKFDLMILNKITRTIYLQRGFNQFIKQIDKVNGCLKDMYVNNELINLNTIKDIINSKCSTQFDVNNYYKFIDISKYHNTDI